ncbi:unnamed protein product [Lactuca saligna]|uniref:ATP-dependent DNA helicase n=1 Tax=Lactuca saligna TaxID=75948 RepID=A0AA35YVK3_LACSI|nr:unnamed protein product [Lactuca saligna]
MLSPPLILHNLTQKLLWPSQKITTSVFKLKTLMIFPDYNEEKSVSVECDNINVVYHDAVTPTTTSLKRSIEIVTTTESFEWPAHSRIRIPINLNKKSFCSIMPGNDVAALLNKASLIIWDEAPMMNRHCFEAVDRTLRDIILPKNNNIPFGGKTIVFGGDFQQIIPVIQRGNRSDIVQTSLHSLRLWRECTILRLTVNMRLQFGCPKNDFEETKSFANWILKIGEGTIGGPNDGEVEVEFPEDVTVPSTGDHIHLIVSCIYSSFKNNLDDPSYFQDKAILVSTNEEVDAINDYMLELMKDEGKTYLSLDSLCETKTEDSFEESVYSPDVLNAFKASGIPNHKLLLKKRFSDHVAS